MKFKSKRIFAAMLLASLMAGCGAVPSKEKVSEALKPIMPPAFSVKSIEKFSALDGVYEAVVVINDQPTVLYLDRTLKHVISGSVVEIASKKNLTYETQMKNKPAGQSPVAVQSTPTPPQKSK